MRRLTTALVLVVSGIAALVPAGAGAASTGQQPPWEAAEEIRTQLFDAQSDLLLDSGDALTDVNKASAAYDGRLRTALKRNAPAADKTVRSGLADASIAAAKGDEAGVAAARGQVWAALLAGSTTVIKRAVARKHVDVAREWILLRDYRTATRFTRPGVDATLAIRGLNRGTQSAEAAEHEVSKDLLDAYQGRLRELISDAKQADQRNFGPRRAELTAHAAGYWSILRDRYRRERGATETAKVDKIFSQLAAEGKDSSNGKLAKTADAATAALDGFTAAPFSQAEQARRAQQLIRFAELIPVEYDHGVSGTTLTAPFEIQEGVAFHKGATAAFADLEGQLKELNPKVTAQAKADLDKLGKILGDAARNRKVVPLEDVQALTDKFVKELKSEMPAKWTEPTDESEFDLIALTLDRLEAAVGAGQYDRAEQARLEAYAFFEFGPELKLRPFNPELAADVEGLVWFGARGKQGLGTLIAQRAPRREIRDSRIALDEALLEAKGTLGEATSEFTVITNSAVIVFREGLEAVLILLAVTASFVGANRKRRKPVFVGAIAALFASVLTWLIAVTVLGEFAQYGEKLEAVVGVVAIAVLLMVMNWFFHGVYWTGNIKHHHQRRKRALAMAGGGILSAQVIGLALLGFTSVYREGFETVLFLQSLQLSAGTGVVLGGVALGLAATAVVAVIGFVLQKKLPYKKMLIVTGLLLVFVLFTMVGQTVRTFQGVGWLPITPINVDLPFWTGMWFGIYPTVETIAAQIAAVIFVIGSYFLAEHVSKTKKKKAAVELAERRAAEGVGKGLTPPTSGHGNGSTGNNGNGLKPEAVEEEQPEPVQAHLPRAGATLK